MGGVIGKAANGIGGVIGSAFAAPIKTIFGASCEYAIDTMQSVCLKEAGVKASGSLEEETTVMGRTFGGYLRFKADEESIYQALSTAVGVLDSIEATIAKFFSKQIGTVLFILTELRSMFDLEDEFLEELELAIALVSTLLAKEESVQVHLIQAAGVKERPRSLKISIKLTTSCRLYK
ncbi:hypothetical protein ACB098_12G147200 [Castanea mollissima]